MNEDFRMEQGYKEAAYGDSLGRYTAKTFGWMFIGLLITFGVAIGMYMTDGLYYVSRVPAGTTSCLSQRLASLYTCQHGSTR